MQETINKKSKEAGVQARRDYYKEWRAKNKDKIKEYNARYWERKAAEREALNVKTGTK